MEPDSADARPAALRRPRSRAAAADAASEAKNAADDARAAPAEGDVQGDAASSTSLRRSSAADELSSEAREAVDALCLDQRRRWLAGERPPTEAYFAQRPELALRTAELIELVYNEYLIREELFDQPDAADFFRRFPSCAEALRRQLELHAALQHDETRDSAPSTAADLLAADDASRAGRDAAFFPTFPSVSDAAAAEEAEPRFEPLRRIGAGGMGVVHAAYDRRWRQVVALKTLHRQDPAALLRLKREFRVLADHSHPNLVQLFELFVDQGKAYFTMEFVEGLDFVSWCRSPSAPRDEGALRGALRQLVEGLQAVHSADKLHCDLKPSNVLVAASGRVVLLDFGMAHDLRAAAPFRPAARNAGEAPSDYLRGTIAYLAPERFRGEPASRAADWYAVGVMLYQALVGRPPFAGGAAEVVRGKLRGGAVRPRALGSTVSPELEQLCLDWLSLDPEARPSAEAALARLADAAPTRRLARREEPEALVGRDDALRFLHEAFREAAAGKSRRLLVHGASGMGKTALVQRFAAELEASGAGRWIAGRCREHESIPFKAVDALLDRLAQLLQQLPTDEAASLLPPNAGALAELFPALLRCPAAAAARKLQPPPVDPVQQRTAAFEALGGLLAALSRKTPLTVWIDDVQWGDGDSARLLAYTLRAAEGAPILWLACGRSEHLAESPFLCELRAALGPDAYHERALPPLAPEDAAALALRQWAAFGASADADPAPARRAELIARQSSGNPFLVLELARGEAAEAVGRSSAPAPADDARVDAMLRARIGRTTPAAQRLLEVFAVAGAPLPSAVAARAAAAEDDPQKALMELRACRLVRTWRQGGLDLAEPYHDRIREGVVRGLPTAAKQARHRGIAEAVEAEPDADPRPLARHFHAAAEPLKAIQYAEAAGRAAYAAAAFDEAAQFFRLAADHAGPAGERNRPALRGLADALAGAGRCGEAGVLYEELAAEADPGESADLRTRAVKLLLRSGRFNEGVECSRSLVRSLGLTWPSSGIGLAVRFLAVRIGLAVRGLGYRPPPAAAPSEETLRRIDGCWTTGSLLANTDAFRCFYYLSLASWYALRAGDTGRTARTLAFEALLESTSRGRDLDRVWKRFDEATRLAEASGDPRIAAAVEMFRCGTWFHAGDWAETVRRTGAALRFLRGRCTEATFEISWCHVYRMHALFYVGAWKQLRRDVMDCMESARERGDAFLAAEVRSSSGNAVWLAADDVERAERELAAAVRSRPQSPGVSVNFIDLIAEVHLLLYQRRGVAAWNAMQRAWPRLKGAMQFHVQVIHVEMAQLRARAALAALAEGAPPRGPRATLAEDLRTLARADYPWAAAVGALHAASLASLQGRRAEAVRLLDAAAAGCDRHEFALYAAAARRRKGELLGGPEGEGLVAAADARFAAEEVRRPERMIHLLAPGFFPVEASAGPPTSRGAGADGLPDGGVPP